MEIEPFECFTAVPGRLAEGMVDVEAVNKEDDAVHRVTDAKKPPGRSPEGPGRPGGHARGDIESIICSASIDVNLAPMTISCIRHNYTTTYATLGRSSIALATQPQAE